MIERCQKKIEGFDDARDLLQQWGCWVRSGSGMPRCTSPMYALMRDMVGSSVPTPLIEDRTAMLVDGAVARLKQRDGIAAEALFMYYPSGMDIQGVARRLRCGRVVASAAIDRGIVWVGAALFDMEPMGEEV